MRHMFERDPKVVLRFILAGNARVTLLSRKTGTRFTYRVAKPNDTTDPYGNNPNARNNIRFVGVLAGPDNTNDYKYVGCIYPNDMNYVHGRKAKIPEGAPSAKAFAWFWMQLSKGNIPEQLEVWHEGSCGQCGRALTDPESIARGIGPICAQSGGY